MSITLQLPPELESELAAEAAKLGLSLHEYALRLLSASRAPGSQPRDGAELVAYWQAAALIGTRPDIVDALAHARTLRSECEQRKRA